MLFEARWTALRLASRAGFKLWSSEGRALAWLILSTARKAPDAPSKLTREHVLRAAISLAGSKKARERVAQALGVSVLDAWMIQESLGRAAGGLHEREESRPN